MALWVEDEEHESLGLQDRLAPAGGIVARGGRGDDRIRGTDEDDRIIGRGGDDRLAGQKGADEIEGRQGDDLLRGGGGSDELAGGPGRDLLIGGGGADRLDGGGGGDVMRGGGADDVFVFDGISARADRILDFDEGDLLDLGPLLERLGPGARSQDFVSLRLAGEDTVVAVDRDGGGDGFRDLVVIEDSDARLVEVTPDPLPDPIRPGRIRVEVDDFLTLPRTGDGARALINQLDHAGDGSGRLFVADSRGTIYRIKPDGDLADRPFLDVARALGGDLLTDLPLQGLRSFAFHPDFDTPGARGFGKVYTAQYVSAESAPPGTPVFATGRGADGHDLLMEWTVDPARPNRVDPKSGREVLRIEQIFGSHNIGDIRFDPNAEPGDPDYGLLHAGIGDGGNTGTVPGALAQGQDTSTLNGTVIRIDPLQRGKAPYSVPADNPFARDPEILDEIWAYGFRHPQFLSFDLGGDGRMLIDDIGQNHIEEVNIGEPGGNYGWGLREGTFMVERNDADTLYELPAYEASFDFTYPVLQYDHDEGFAISNGFVYRGEAVPALEGRYVFGDIVNGRIFHADLDAMERGDARIRELVLLEGGEPVTLLDLVGADRADLRFGQDADGEILIMTKQDGVIRTMTRPEADPRPAAVDEPAAAGAALDTLLAAAEDAVIA